jgi:amino acid adenylation domain-containing protein
MDAVMKGTSPTSLLDYVETSAERHPDRVAIVDPSGDSITYSELNARADRLAGFLLRAGVKPGDRVGVVLPKGTAAISAFLGIMKARAAYVPADYTAPAARNRVILSDCAVRVAFLADSGESILDSWPEDSRPAAVVFVGNGSATPRLGTTAFRWDDAINAAPARVDGRHRRDLAYILYTSGSTGIPKGVMLTHENALSFVDWCSEVFTPTHEDRFSSHAPFHFDLSVLDIYVPLKHGATLYVISEETGKAPKELAEFISEKRLTIWYSTPSILALLAQYGDLGAKDYSSLRLVLFAGEVFPVKHLRHVTERWPGPAYYNLYGPTETNVCTFARIPTPIHVDRTVPYPIGWPCSHCQALVLDDDREVRRGDEGLLYIAGPSVFEGYWNRPEQNAAAFIDRDGRRWYNTGDVVREDPEDGYIYVGRRDRMVKRRGYRIELGEIERGLYQHPLVGEAAVIAVSDETGVRVVAHLSMRGGERPSIIELKAFCARHLPSYMSPDLFLFMDALPRTSTNKVDYQRLAVLSQAQPPAQSPGA